MKIPKDAGKVLLELARQSISSEFLNSELNIPIKLDNLLSEKRGVFVTITKNGKLRGCIGFVDAIFPLGIGIIRAARAAAFNDPRFEPLDKKELNLIKLEITILTKPKEIRVKNKKELPNKIKIGTDGLIVKKDNYSGLLLPQVAEEWGWNAKEFLEHACEKAGLNKDAWLEEDTKIYKFQGQIFKEN